jgi:hypothetical protein
MKQKWHNDGTEDSKKHKKESTKIKQKTESEKWKNEYMRVMGENWSNGEGGEDIVGMYRVLRAQANWTFILPSEFPEKELCHLPRNMPPRGITYWEVW